MQTIQAYKLFRVRKDGTLGPLFIDCKRRVKPSKWEKAEAVRTPGFTFRPGWHACAEPFAPHLSTKGRLWCIVQLRGVKKHQRPAAQGGLWYTAKWLRVISYIGIPEGTRINRIG